MARDDRVAQLIQLLRDAEESDDDLAQIVRLDLFKEFGLEMNQGGIMSVQGYNGGGRVKKPEYIPGQNVEKIKQGISQTKGIATRRMDPSTYKQWIEKLGPKFQKTELVRGKPKIVGDLHKFEKSLNKKGLTLWQDKSPTMMNAVTKELNSMLKAKGVEGIPYKNVGKTTKRGLAENLASRARGFFGKYAERFSAATKKEWWDDALKLLEKGDKKFGTKKTKKKLRWIAQQLNKKWPSITIGTTMGLLSTSGFGAVLTKLTALPYATDVLGLTDIMGFKDVEPENTEPGYFEKLKREKYGEDADLSYFERIKKQNMRGGGLMDIDYMTRPLGYQEGGDINRDFDRIDRLGAMRRGTSKVSDDNIINLAFQIATQQRDTSEENINLIINQLQALVPSIEETSRVEGTDLMTKGLQSLVGKIRSTMNPDRRDRGVGFERVR